MDDRLAEAVTDVALRLPAPQVRELASAFDQHADAAAARRSGALARVTTAGGDEAGRRLLSLWASDATTDGATLGVALRAAARTMEHHREQESVEVVWTGPEARGVPTRTTSAVLAAVIAGAERSLLVVSFAAYRVAATSSALRRAIDDGVRVDLVLETAQDSGGKLSRDAADAFGTLGDGVRVWHWPRELRPVGANGAPAVLHAKAVVADARVAFVTSANLTQAAARDNLELGLLVTGGAVPRRIDEAFDDLRTSRILRPVR